MRLRSQIIDQVARQPLCGYQPDAAPATEPTALAAIALADHNQTGAAIRAAEWLALIQTNEGSLGVSADLATPRWPTSLAVLAWQRVDPQRYNQHIRSAVRWILAIEGEISELTEDIGHNTQLVGWPWVEGTHSWVEPTSFCVQALKAAGHASHPRTREAIRVLVDRQISTGGWNYGNTEVLGQTLLPHVQPTGSAMLALAGEADVSACIERSLVYLERSLSAKTTTASMCWGVIGLAAHDRRPPDADLWLESAYGRTIRRDQSPYKLALLALAASATKGIL